MHHLTEHLDLLWKRDPLHTRKQRDHVREEGHDAQVPVDHLRDMWV